MLGDWVGKSRLWYDWIASDQVNESPSRLRVNGVASGKFFLLTHTWKLDGAPHEGVLMAGNETEKLTVRAEYLRS